jgi:O-methyltransferase
MNSESQEEATQDLIDELTAKVQRLEVESKLFETGLQRNEVTVAAARGLYLNLMEACITNIIYEDAPLPASGATKFDPLTRAYGGDWPSKAHSMIGLKRIANLRREAERVIKTEIPGDFIETGIWRGGACIMMRAVLKAYGVSDRRVWAADSFAGLPPPNAEKYPADRDSIFHTYPELCVPLEEVKLNFAKYDLLDNQIVFLKGLFKDTLPMAPIESLALLRLDGDMYESTQDVLTNLYDRLSVWGSVIIDDYHVVGSCREAVDQFRESRGISDPIYEIDGVGVYWIKSVA